MANSLTSKREREKVAYLAQDLSSKRVWAVTLRTSTALAPHPCYIEVKEQVKECETYEDSKGIHILGWHGLLQEGHWSLAEEGNYINIHCVPWMPLVMELEDKVSLVRWGCDKCGTPWPTNDPWQGYTM